jgi:hypothetical protein
LRSFSTAPTELRRAASPANTPALLTVSRLASAVRRVVDRAWTADRLSLYLQVGVR